MIHSWIGLLALCSFGLHAAGQSEQPLADYFGFDDPRFLVVDDNMGPLVVADMNGDGLTDLVVVNNRKSRVELHIQRAEPRADNDLDAAASVNEFSRSRYYDRQDISVSHQVTDLHVEDLNGDGRLDMLYTGRPASVVALVQSDDLSFEDATSRRLPGLSGRRGGVAIASVRGDDTPELITLISGRISIFEMQGPNTIGEPTQLGSGAEIEELIIEDFDGNGLLDVVGIIPDDNAPLRLWLQIAPGTESGEGSTLGPEIRFAMPPLVEVAPVRFADLPGASIGVIESRSRRVLLYDVVTEQIDAPDDAGFVTERDVPFEVYAIPGGSSSARALTTADINQDGLDDILIANPDGNALSLHLQQQHTGIREGVTFSTFKNSSMLAAGQWIEGGPLEVFVMSEDENVVGVSSFDPRRGRLDFPRPLPLANPGATPVAMAVIRNGSETASLAVVVRERRDHWLEILTPDGPPRAIELDSIDRPPSAIISGDFDGDGSTDVLLTGDDEPPVMIRSVEDTELASATNGRVLDDRLMPQVGLIQAAGPTNTAVVDINNDGSDELLIAAENFVRACTYDAETGWRVIEQMAVTHTQASFSGLTITGSSDAPRITVGDTGNEGLVIFARDETSEAWTVVDRLRVPAFDLGSLTGGAFSGDDQPNILCHSADGIGVARLSGERVALKQFASYRSDAEDQYEFRMASGDLNDDGYTDLVVLDAGEQRCKVFTFTSSRRLLKTFEFETFQRRLFDAPERRTFEPRAVILDDVSGDGVDDMIFEVHDRYVIHPAQSR